MTATAKAGAKPRPRSVRAALPPPPGAPANPPPAPSGPLHFSSAAELEPEARTPLFYIDDAEYTIPSDPSASIGLGAQKVLAEEREKLLAAGLDLQAATMTAMGMAQHYVLREMLGPEGYEALTGYKRLKRDDLKRLMEVCTEKAYAAMEDEESPNS